MKYRNIALGLILLAVLTLTGCACKHEWVAADCVNPQICTKCEEVGTPALGHDWADATCTAPEICVRCSATQGEPLGHEWSAATCSVPETCARCSETQGAALAHTYCDWTFGEDDMTHTCTVCDFEETAELDRELYLKSCLSGYWVIKEYMMADGTYRGAVDILGHNDFLNTYVVFGEGNNCEFHAGLSLEKFVMAGAWECIAYESSPEEDVYAILLYNSAESFVFTYHLSADGSEVLMFEATNGTMCFSQHNELAQTLAGNWGIAPSEEFGYYGVVRNYWFTLNEDQTVTGNINGEFEGVWFLHDMLTVDFDPVGDEWIGLYIDCIWNGKRHEFYGSVKLENTHLSTPVYYLVNPNTGRDILFQEISDTEYDVILNSTKLLAGTWISTEFGGVDTAGEEPAYDREPTTAFTITFSEDGTFTSADGNNTYTGIYRCEYLSFDETLVDTEIPYGPYYQYYLQFEGESQIAYGVLNAQPGYLSHLSIDKYPNAGRPGTIYFMKNGSGEQ